MAQPTTVPGKIYIETDSSGQVRVFAVGEDGVPLEIHTQQRDLDGKTYHIIAPKGHAATLLRSLPYKRAI